MVAGIAGALSASVVQFIASDFFNFFLSVYLLVGLVVGGLGWPLGCLVGGALLIFPNFVEGFSPRLRERPMDWS
jgi:branched-chain amino acid transport system permease protein